MMWNDVAELHEIIPNLFLTSINQIREYKSEMKYKKIHYAINLSGDDSVNNLFLQALNVPIDDCETENIAIFFPITNELLSHVLAKRKKIVVFCQAGVSRSPTIVLAFLNQVLHTSLDFAFKLVRSHRSIIKPNKGFLLQLYAHEHVTPIIPPIKV
jgi:dual specificity phosphatase 12